MPLKKLISSPPFDLFRLLQDLGKIPITELQSAKLDATCNYLFCDGFLTSNDWPLSAKLSDHYAHPDSSSKGYVSIVVGESHLLSLLPLLRSEVVLCVDLDPRVHHVLTAQLDILVKSPSFDVFKRDLLSLYERVNETNIKTPLAASSLTAKKLDNGDKVLHESPLLSEDAFLKARDAARKTHLVYMMTNMMNKEDTRQLGQILNHHGLKLKFLNLTNLRNYTKPCPEPPYNNTLCNAIHALFDTMQTSSSRIIEGIYINHHTSLDAFSTSVGKEIVEAY